MLTSNPFPFDYLTNTWPVLTSTSCTNSHIKIFTYYSWNHVHSRECYFFLLFSFRYLCQFDHGIRNTRTFTFKLKRFSRPFARVYSALIHSCVQKKLTFQKCGGQISFLCKTFVLSEWSCHFHLFKIFEASQSCRAMLHNVWNTLCLVGSPSSIFL